MQNVNANFHRKDKIGLSLSPVQFCYCFVYNTNIKPDCKGKILRVTYFHSPARTLCQLTPVCLFIFKCRITERASPKDERKQCFHVQEIWGCSNRTFSL